MKKSGYRTIYHIYLIFFLSMLGALIAAIVIFCLLITVRTPDGAAMRSDWPKNFTENFGTQIFFNGDQVQVGQKGIEQLQEYGIGLQILNGSGQEIFSYRKPEQAAAVYSDAALLQLGQTGGSGEDNDTSFIGTFTNDGKDYLYLLFFPVRISKITVYLNTAGFAGGKTIISLIFGILFLAVLVFGCIYGFWTTRVMGRMTASIRKIATRSYLPIQEQGSFRDVYAGLNVLDAEIRESDGMRSETERLRREWIANITHDLKTPLSPIKGYAEILREQGPENGEQCKRYAQVMLKNVSYMEELIDDLKLTYQLENGMLPPARQEHNFVRFIKELVIDILNNPEYEQRTIHFDTMAETVRFSFDQVLLTRAFQNLIINAFVHGKEDTEVTLYISVSDESLEMVVSDNGNGMAQAETEQLFQRYYRGQNTEHKPEGTGLGLAIAKKIVELHGGTISVSSAEGVGTAFQIRFPIG